MNKESTNFLPITLVLDVDGVLTDGKIYSSQEGKLFKVFGPDDHDAINLIKKKLRVVVVSADERGFAITKRRVEGDMGLELFLVSAKERVEWVASRFNPAETVYMGDGIYDALVFELVGYSIAPRNAFTTTRTKADFVTQSKGSEGAVAEACVHLLDRFFGGFSLRDD